MKKILLLAVLASLGLFQNVSAMEGPDDINTIEDVKRWATRRYDSVEVQNRCGQTIKVNGALLENNSKVCIKPQEGHKEASVEIEFLNTTYNCRCGKMAPVGQVDMVEKAPNAAGEGMRITGFNWVEEEKKFIQSCDPDKLIKAFKDATETNAMLGKDLKS